MMTMSIPERSWWCRRCGPARCVNGAGCMVVISSHRRPASDGPDQPGGAPRPETLTPPASISFELCHPNDASPERLLLRAPL